MLRANYLMLFFLFAGMLTGQQASNLCRIYEAMPDRAANRAACSVTDYSVEEILDGCYKVYVRVNVHFFLNAAGLTDAARSSDRYSPREALYRAENLLAKVNGYSSGATNNAPWNQERWGAVVTDPQCLPIRYLLNEVIIHPQIVSVNTAFNTLGNDPHYAGAMNLFVLNYPGSSNGAARLGGRVLTVENFGALNTVHEFGHAFTLLHPHDVSDEYDGCPDTWYRAPEAYDANEDGIAEYYGNTCWGLGPEGPLSPNTGIDDPQYEYCEVDSINVFSRHPCCNADYLDNNAMTYGNAATNISTAVMTPCQVKKMLTNLIEEKCDLLEVVRPDCAPTSAFATLLPSVDTSKDCRYCFRLEASTKESEYRIKITTANGMQTFDSDWRNGPADSFCIVVENGPQQLEDDLILNAGTNYRFSLETRNACDSDTYDYDFTTPSLVVCPAVAEPDTSPVNLPHLTDLTLFPNPTEGSCTLRYSLDRPLEVRVFLVPGLGNLAKSAIPIAQASGFREAGRQTHLFSADELYPGLNYVVIQVGDERIIKSVIKVVN
jgi:hypothetical protein